MQPEAVLPLSKSQGGFLSGEGIWGGHHVGNEAADYWPPPNEPQLCSCWRLWESRAAPSLSDPGLGERKAEMKGRGR